MRKSSVRLTIHLFIGLAVFSEGVHPQKAVGAVTKKNAMASPRSPSPTVPPANAVAPNQPQVANVKSVDKKESGGNGVQGLAQDCTALRESEGISRVLNQFYSLWPQTERYVSEIPDIRSNAQHSCHIRTRALGDGSLFVNYFDALNRREGARAALLLDQLDRAMGCLSARQLTQYSLYFLSIMDQAYLRSESKISLKCRPAVQREWSALVLNPTLRLLEKRRMMGSDAYQKLQRLIPAALEAASRPDSRFQSHGVWVTPKSAAQGLVQMSNRCPRDQRGLLTLRSQREGVPTCDGATVLLSALSRPESLGMGECALGELMFLGVSPASGGQSPAQAQRRRAAETSAYCPLTCMGEPRADHQTEASREFYEGVESQGMSPFGAPLPSLQSLCQQAGQVGAGGGGGAGGSFPASEWGGASGCVSSLGQAAWRAISEGRNTHSCRPKGADLGGAMSAGDLSAFQIDRKCIGSVMNEGPNGETGGGKPVPPASAPGVSAKVNDAAKGLLNGVSGGTPGANGQVKPEVGKTGVGIAAKGSLSAGGVTVSGKTEATVMPGGEAHASAGLSASTSLGGGTLTVGGGVSGGGELSGDKQSLVDLSGGDAQLSVGLDYSKDLVGGTNLSAGVSKEQGGPVTASIGISGSFNCPPDSPQCSSSCTANELSDSISQECMESAGIGLGERAATGKYAKGFDPNAKNPVQRAGAAGGGRRVGQDGGMQTWGAGAESELAACLQAQGAWRSAGAECQMAIDCGEDRAPVTGPNGTCSCGNGVQSPGVNAQIGMARARFRACTQSQGAGPDGAEQNENGGPCALWGGLDRDHQGSPSLGGDPLLGGNGGPGAGPGGESRQ